MGQVDFKPSRLTVALNAAEAFIKDFYDQNPLSQLAIIITRNSIAEKLTELSGNPSKHISALRAQNVTEGEASLENALEVARSSLCYVPKYGSREIVVLFESLTTCDPGDIYSVMDQLKKDNIHCSVVGVGAEVHVCKMLAEKTNGSYHVALNEEHFRQILFAHSPPPPSTLKTETSLIRMGFPQRRMDNYPSLCVCHQLPKYGGYFCPQCMAKFCDLPTDCQICGLTLISSPHLARSYHHLFPVPIFVENISNKQQNCSGCIKEMNNTSSFACPKCSKSFCSECDDYIHESLHNCPGKKTNIDRFKIVRL